jgi:hypothetical protein
MSSSYSSNITGNLNVTNITNSGARLLMTKPLSGFSGGIISETVGGDGVTSGDVVRYDIPSGKYCKSIASSANQSEVVGVIETISDETVNIVLLGQIIYPLDKLFDNATVPDGSCGGNDVYFLSGVTAGRLENIAPSEPSYVAKPVLQIAPDDDFTANVVNYIGYQIGGQVVGENLDGTPTGTTVNVFNFGDTGGVLDTSSSSTDWYDLGHDNYLPLTTDSEYYDGNTGKLYNSSYINTFNRGRTYGRLIKVTVTADVDPNSVNKNCLQKNGAERTFTGTVKKVDITNKQLIISSKHENDINIGKKLFVGSNLQYTVTSWEDDSFKLPKTSTVRVNVLYKDIDENKISTNKTEKMYVQADNHGLGVSIAQKLTIDELTLNKDITLSTADGTTTITGLAETIDAINTDLNKLSDKGLITRANTTISKS